MKTNPKAMKKLLAWTSELLAWYEESGMLPEPGWEQCHHPKPRCLGGEEVVWMTREHHAIHGILQSEAFDFPCTSFRYTPDVKGTEWEERHHHWLRIGAAKGGEASRRNGWAPDHRDLIQRNSREAVRKPIELVCNATGDSFLFESQAEAARGLNLFKSAITLLTQGKRNHHKGFSLRHGII